MCGAARAISLRLAYPQQMGRWVVAFLAAALVGCGGGSGPLGSKDEIGKVSSSEQMRVALSNAGLSCSDYQAVAKNDRKFGTENATDVGKCELEGETIELAVWKDRGQVENWMGFSKTLGCSFGKALGVSSFDYVAADTWVISNVSATLARKISDAVGGTPHHVDLGSCSDQDPPVGSGPRVTVTETATQTVTQPPSTVAVPSSAPSLPSGGGPAVGSAAKPGLDEPGQPAAPTPYEGMPCTFVEFGQVTADGTLYCSGQNGAWSDRTWQSRPAVQRGAACTEPGARARVQYTDYIATCKAGPGGSLVWS